MSSNGWIGVDFDGTLAIYDGWKDDELGAPIPKMVERVKQWLSEGREVRIVTARVGATGLMVGPNRDCDAFADRQRHLIQRWCEEHIGQALKVTASKDFAMVELWDDRAVGLISNTGDFKDYEDDPDSDPCVSCQRPSHTATPDDASMCWQCFGSYNAASFDQLANKLRALFPNIDTETLLYGSVDQIRMKIGIADEEIRRALQRFDNYIFIDERDQQWASILASAAAGSLTGASTDEEA